MRTSKATLSLSLLSVACGGPRSEPTPDPYEGQKIDRIAQDLGVQRTIDGQSFAPTPEPDGLVLVGWERRRADTLEGRLPVARLPALQKPATVGETIEWEKNAQRLEGRMERGIVDYGMYTSMAERRCPKAAQPEAEWFKRRQREHKEGLHPDFFDWSGRYVNFKATCQAEERADREKRRVQASITQQDKQRRQVALDACKANFQEVYEEYGRAPTVESGARVTAASEEQKRCEVAADSAPQ